MDIFVDPFSRQRTIHFFFLSLVAFHGIFFSHTWEELATCCWSGGDDFQVSRMLGCVEKTTNLPWWWLRVVTSLLKGEQWDLVEAWRRRKTKWGSFLGIKVFNRRENFFLAGRFRFCKKSRKRRGVQGDVTRNGWERESCRKVVAQRFITCCQDTLALSLCLFIHYYDLLLIYDHFDIHWSPS